MVKNLNQLKKTLKAGTCFEIIAHCRPECIGQLREVSKVDTTGFYTRNYYNPDDPINAGNGGNGAVLWWSKAANWAFDDGSCTLYFSGQDQTEKSLVISFRIVDAA